MRFGSVAPACIGFIASVATALAGYPTLQLPVPPTKEVIQPQTHVARPPHSFSFRSIESQVDNQVVANLLTELPRHANDVAVTVFTGEIARCESATCQVPMTVRVQHAEGPIVLTFAVASPRGEISDVKHAECSVANCVVSLILERGQNTVSVGVLDGLAQATGYVTTRVNANRNVADRGKSEWF